MIDVRDITPAEIEYLKEHQFPDTRQRQAIDLLLRTFITLKNPMRQAEREKLASSMRAILKAL